MRRVLIRAALGALLFVLVAAGAAAGFFWAMTSHFNPAPPRMDYPKPGSALEAQRQDIDYFDRLMALDRSFSPAARAEAERRVADLRAEKTPLAFPQFRAALLEIAALADNGHTHVFYADKARPALFPFRLALFSDGLYVTHASAGQADLLGSRLLAIDGLPADEVMQRLEKLRGGTADWLRYNANLQIEFSDSLYGTGVAHEPGQAAFRFLLPSGAVVEREIAADQSRNAHDPVRWYSPEPVSDLRGWRSFTPRALPLTLRDFDAPFREIRMPQSCAALIQLKANTDEDGHSISDFLRKTEADLEAHPPCALILDNRFNGGGDYTKTAHFAHALPRLVPGNIVILTSAATFSAGITTTAFVKEAAGARARILGEPVGDRLAFFSEGGEGCLPHAPLCFSYETGKHDYAHPCRDWRVCYWLNWFYPVRVKTLAPDETIPMRFADWQAGHDRAFERALAIATGKD